MANKKKKKPVAKKLKQNPKHDVVPRLRDVLNHTISLIISNYKTFGLLILLYGALTLVLVQGPTLIDVDDIKRTIVSSFEEDSESTALVASVLIGETIGVSEITTTFSVILFILFSLATIRILRTVWEGKSMTVKQAFYKGMNNIVQFVLLCMIISIQLVPFLLGVTAYSLAVINDVIITLGEQLFFVSLMLIGFAISTYMLSASLFAIYIVTLPNMSPFLALRSARELVKHRRGKVLSKVLIGLGFYITIVITALLILIAFLPLIAPWYWWLVGIISLPILHTFMYTLYRELI